MSSSVRFPDRNAAIIAKRQAGMWPRQIAREMGLSHNVVIGVCNRAGLSGVDGNQMVPRGEQNGHAKLSEQAVHAIRTAHVVGSRTHGACALARRYGVGVSTLHDVLQGRTWAHVGEPSSAEGEG